MYLINCVYSQVRLRRAGGAVHATVPLRGGADPALRASGRGRARRRGHDVGGPRRLPALARAAEHARARRAAVAAARRAPRHPQGARLQPPQAEALVRPQAQAAAAPLHSHRLSRRIFLLDLTSDLYYLFSQ